jgi:hypothetical protein
MVHDIPELHGIDIPPMPTYKPDTPTPKDGSP